MNSHNLEATRREIASLRRSVHELSILNDLARDIGASVDFTDIMETVIKRSAGAVRASQATITMVERESFLSAGTVVRDIERETPDFHLTQNLIGMLATHKSPLLFNNPAEDERLRGVPLQDGVRNLLCVPLLVGNMLVGILAAYNKRRGEDFDDVDKRVLAIIGAQSAQILERARLFEIEQADLKTREELRMASDIQMSLLPGSAPKVTGYEISGISVPARQVGGDYFDYFELASGKLGVAVGDVSGKGVPAAMLMANLQATLRSQALRESECKTCITWCNRLLFRSTSPEKFATLVYCTIDIDSHEIAYSNAGHEYPVILAADGTTRKLRAGGPPAGVLDDFDYQEGVESLAPGELMVIYSDGVTDMLNPDDEPYGMDRFLDCVSSTRSESAETMTRSLVDSVRAHANGSSPLDDVTVVILKRLE